MNNNSVQIPLNIGDEGGDQPQPDSPRVEGNDQPPPYSPRAMETNEQPDAPAPNVAEEERVYDGELEPISGDESPSPSPPPPQPRNPTPPPRREEEIMVTVFLFLINS